MSGTQIPHSAPAITDDDIGAVADRLRSGMIARGSDTVAFEREFASATGFSFAMATGSGTAAITVALKALGVGPGDEVVIPTYVCDSVMYAVRATGATEVLCDTGTAWLMDASTVAQHIGPRTSAIVAVHVFGVAVDSEALRATGIPVVEDCCQALGHTADGRWIGAGGDVGVFSFHPTKCLAAAEGGMVTTSRGDIAQQIREMLPTQKHFFAFSDLQATLARSQLRRYEAVLQRRSEIAARYFELLPPSLTATLHELRYRSMFFRFPLTRRGDFDAARQRLADRGIQVRRGVDSLLHRQLGQPDELFPNAVRCFGETISIPILPQLSDEDVRRVAREIVSLHQETEQ